MVRVPLTTAQIKRGQDLGAALRIARGPRTMVDVASRAALSVETLRKIETGRSPSPEFFTVLQICSALGITMDGLLPCCVEPERAGSVCAEAVGEQGVALAGHQG
ncbi:XRE family transcriptional regulator [Cryobacterium suzukii]|uniref:XRE family transcriptional regulator n=1 Tax=Cryobacterium suzukii TaxID=1259198 RepID=A0A4R9AD58_9MICO|nr:helix-turn-helix transcriptional regulator [Cryobacterium suzukii]TFD57413.1 XRE family transcriptional regulator [Cryobacterium suzukii]